ncbi:maleylpyruvate isomerase family mycothiol-dependent enzyme [Saccharopolyspora sp. NPDC050389]|uniref:maleylpyruvate isomerase family mycothiol-dependent enzyme n=1 Tax=Saccharopolyspora sp. NPDC050389 TaxID=3155516 RepID=UPI0033E14E4A
MVHAERAALAADLADLTDEQWATPSLCTGLTVREVLAHLTAAASLNPARWLAGVIRCRFAGSPVRDRRRSASVDQVVLAADVHGVPGLQRCRCRGHDFGCETGDRR